MHIKHKKLKKVTPRKTDVFPLWALFVSLGCIGAVGFFFNRSLTNTKKIQTQAFGFNFY